MAGCSKLRFLELHLRVVQQCGGSRTPLRQHSAKLSCCLCYAEAAAHLDDVGDVEGALSEHLLPDDINVCAIKLRRPQHALQFLPQLVLCGMIKWNVVNFGSLQHEGASLIDAAPEPLASWMPAGCLLPTQEHRAG